MKKRKLLAAVLTLAIPAVGIVVASFSPAAAGVHPPRIGIEPDPTFTFPPLRPAAPANFRITEFRANYVKLTWTDRASNEDRFVIERGNRSGSGWQEVKLVVDHRDGQPESTGTSISTVMTDSTATVYCYRVSARNAAGTSSPSQHRCTAPDLRPTSLGDPIFSQPADKPFSLTWSVCNDGGVSAAASFDFALGSGRIGSTTRSTTSLASGACRLHLWSFPFGLPAGNYSWGVTVDANNDVDELFESNNAAGSAFRVV
jgi:hypothetical protein